MSNHIIIDKQDDRYETLKKGFNLRWPTQGKEGDYIYICDSAESVHRSANDALEKGYRITIRSGGHCYEGLVSNKLEGEEHQPLAIIDLSLMTGMEFSEAGDVNSPYNTCEKYKFRAATGNQNWDGYNALYKTANRTIPGGSCYSVGSGGHICGGGYGLLSRLHGLTVDWLSGVDILVPDLNGKGLVSKHVSLNSTGTERDLFIACRGGGGGNYGIILNYYYKDLPQAPRQAYLLTLSWPWASFTKEKLKHFLKEYWRWFKENDRHWNSSDPALANGGLFTLLKLQHRSTGDISLLIQYTGTNGRVDALNQTAPLIDFVHHMNSAAGTNAYVASMENSWGPVTRLQGKEARLSNPLKDARLMDWLYLTQTINGSGSNQFGKYKSFYQIENFTDVEVDAIWTHFNQTGQTHLNQALLQIDSYGGCVNTNDEVSNPTAVHQRHSLLKSQLQAYWTDPINEDKCIRWCQDFFNDFFSQQNGKPFSDNQRYEGCFINYPDVDMRYISNQPGTTDTRWLELYYGDKVNMLINTKRAVDPENIFRSEMSIPVSHP